MRTTWQAYKASWRVLRADPELLLVPPLGLLLYAALLALAIALWVAVIPALERAGQPLWALALVLLSVAWVMVTSLVLLEALVCVSAHERLAGGSPTLGRSLAKVGRRLGPLLAWSTLAAVVVTGLAMLSRLGRVERVLARTGGVALSVATMFVVPSIVLDGVGVRAALPASGRSVRDRFGPVAGRTVSFAAFGALGFLALVFSAGPMAGLVATVTGSEAAAIGALLACILAALVFLALNAVVAAIHKTAVHDAMRGLPVPWYAPEALAPFR